MLYGKKINAVPRTKTPEQALAALMRLCARAERSEEDARRLMTRWGVAPADRERVLERLRRDRFIDDARYAEAFVREKINLSGWDRARARCARCRYGTRTAGRPAAPQGAHHPRRNTL